MLQRSRWRARRRRTVPRAAVLVAAATVLALSPAAPATADPSDQPGGTSGVLDSSALDRLQQRAADVQSGLQQRQAEITRARQDLAAAQAQVQAAPAALADAGGVLAERQR